ncbi:uncharacterized protein LOC103883767 [Papio anubis]|uniref:uncharacterized protein LOC103883767 n=1 Tax=Papio anubis TaxID=9555 RepID=UPI000B7B89E1|nr:uncharacterized protein LOC103883767 [Papio anubis]
MPSEEGGARGSEIVKLCLGCARRRAVLAFPWARARGLRVSRERVSAAASRVLVCARVPGAARPSPAQLRCVQPPARGSARAARPLRLPGVLPTGCAGGCVREGEGSRRVGEEGVPAGGRGRGWREGGFTELQPGPRCACTSRLLKPKHVPKAVFSASGRFLHPQFPPLGLAATNCKRNSLGGEAGGCGGWEGDSEGWEVNAGLDRLSLSFSADL